MEITAEARWFLKGEEQLLEKWFRENGKSFKNEWSESDCYVSLEGSQSLSIKIRDRNFEVKQRTHCETLAFGNTHQGHLEHWIKWEKPLSEQSDIAQIFQQRLLKIEKERLLLFFSAQNNAVKISETKPDEGCQVELSKVKLLKKTFMSFAFESFGSAQNLKRYLITTSAFVFSSLDISPLMLRESLNYAVLISRYA
jgi:hypothetical protein